MIALNAHFLDGRASNAVSKPGGAEVSLKSLEGQPMTLVVASGDVIALNATATTPGMLRLTSIDEKIGAPQDLGIYKMAPNIRRRIPPDGEGGIGYDDKPGVETLRVEFEPCIPDALVDEQTVQPFLSTLKRCSQLLSTDAVARSAFGQGTARGAALTVPVGNPNVGLLAAPRDYRVGQIVRFDIEVIHKPK